MNVKFEYLYRDAGNFKQWGEVIFSNENGLNVLDIDRSIRECLIDQEFFIAEKLNVPVLYFSIFNPELDHGWHEFGSVMDCENEATDLKNRDISDFLRIVNS